MRYLSESSGIVFSACILQLLVYPGKKLLVVYTSVFLRKFLKPTLDIENSFLASGQLNVLFLIRSYFSPNSTSKK